MTRSTLGGAAMALAFIAAIVFIGVAVNELNYASRHPYAYGPAKVIAWGSGAGAVLAVAVAVLAYALTRLDGA
jgi:hypothetical protein